MRRVEKRVAEGSSGKDTHFDRGEAGALSLAIWCIKKCQHLNLINPRGADEKLSSVQKTAQDKL